MQLCVHSQQLRLVWYKHDVRPYALTHHLNRAGYLGAILFEQDLEQPLLSQTLSITGLVDLEGAFPRQQCGVGVHPAVNVSQTHD